MVIKHAYPVVYRSHKPLSFAKLDSTLSAQTENQFTTSHPYHNFSSRFKFFAKKRDYSIVFSRFTRLFLTLKKRTFIKSFSKFKKKKKQLQK